MTDLMNGGGLIDPRVLLTQAWAHHKERSNAERPSALGSLQRLEQLLDAAFRGDLPSATDVRTRLQAEVRLPRVSVPRVRLPRIAASAVEQRRLARGLAVACLALVVASVAALGTIGPDTPDTRPADIALAGTLSPLPNQGAEALAATGLIPREVARLAGAHRPQLAPIVPSQRGALPVGKGMWLWKPELVEGGDPEATVIRARQAGLTHIYVRTGSSFSGFYAQQYLNDLLPRAHRMGIRVYGWDFPYLTNVQDDVNRAVAAIRHTAPGGHRLDGFSADIELRSMGVNITPETASAYGSALRRAVGPRYPLIATVPRPSPALKTYPFHHVTADFDAVAPMVYWLGRDPGTDVAGAMRDLRVLGKPIIPVGQAYDGLAEGGPPGVPSRAEIQEFIKVADEQGALGVSFWSWQHATREAWDAITDAPEFVLPSTPPGAPVKFTPGQIRMYQALLTSLGFPVPQTGHWDERTAATIRAYQEAARLPATGIVDEMTRKVLLTPFASPLG